MRTKILCRDIREGRFGVSWLFPVLFFCESSVAALLRFFSVCFNQHCLWQFWFVLLGIPFFSFFFPREDADMLNLSQILTEAQELCATLKICQGLLYNFIFILDRISIRYWMQAFLIWREINLFWFYFILRSCWNAFMEVNYCKFTTLKMCCRSRRSLNYKYAVWVVV